MSKGLQVRTSIRSLLAIGSESLRCGSMPRWAVLVGLCVVLLAPPNPAAAQLSELEAVRVNLVDATGLLSSGEQVALEHRLVGHLRAGGLSVQEEASVPALVFTVEQAAQERGWHRIVVRVELFEPTPLRHGRPATRVVVWKARASKVFAVRAVGRPAAIARLLDEQAAYVLRQSGPAASSEQGMMHE